MDGRVDFGQVAEIGRKETRGAAAKRILDYGPKSESAAKRLALSPTDTGTDNHQLTTSPPAIRKSNGIAAKRVLDKQMIPEENLGVLAIDSPGMARASGTDGSTVRLLARVRSNGGFSELIREKRTRSQRSRGLKGRTEASRAAIQAKQRRVVSFFDRAHQA